MACNDLLPIIIAAAIIVISTFAVVELTVYIIECIIKKLRGRK